MYGVAWMNEGDGASDLITILQSCNDRLAAPRECI